MKAKLPLKERRLLLDLLEDQVPNSPAASPASDLKKNSPTAKAYQNNDLQNRPNREE